jgi:serine/threonine protein kinase
MPRGNARQMIASRFLMKVALVMKRCAATAAEILNQYCVLVLLMVCLLTRLDRDVAIKILPEQLAQDAEALRRFQREAKAVDALSHPNILAIHDFGAEQSLNYEVMELLEGKTLRARLQRGLLGWRELVTPSKIGGRLPTCHTNLDCFTALPKTT